MVTQTHIQEKDGFLVITPPELKEGRRPPVIKVEGEEYYVLGKPVFTKTTRGILRGLLFQVGEQGSIESKTTLLLANLGQENQTNSPCLLVPVDAPEVISLGRCTLRGSWASLLQSEDALTSTDPPITEEVLTAIETLTQLREKKQDTPPTDFVYLDVRDDKLCYMRRGFQGGSVYATELALQYLREAPKVLDSIATINARCWFSEDTRQPEQLEFRGVETIGAFTVSNLPWVYGEPQTDIPAPIRDYAQKWIDSGPSEHVTTGERLYLWVDSRGGNLSFTITATWGKTVVLREDATLMIRCRDVAYTTEALMFLRELRQSHEGHPGKSPPELPPLEVKRGLVFYTPRCLQGKEVLRQGATVAVMDPHMTPEHVNMLLEAVLSGRRDNSGDPTGNQIVGSATVTLPKRYSPFKHNIVVPYRNGLVYLRASQRNTIDYVVPEKEETLSNYRGIRWCDDTDGDLKLTVEDAPLDGRICGGSLEAHRSLLTETITLPVSDVDPIIRDKLERAYTQWVHPSGMLETVTSGIVHMGAARIDEWSNSVQDWLLARMGLQSSTGINAAIEYCEAYGCVGLLVHDTGRVQVINADEHISENDYTLLSNSTPVFMESERSRPARLDRRRGRSWIDRQNKGTCQLGGTHIVDNSGNGYVILLPDGVMALKTHPMCPVHYLSDALIDEIEEAFHSGVTATAEIKPGVPHLYVNVDGHSGTHVNLVNGTTSMFVSDLPIRCEYTTGGQLSDMDLSAFSPGARFWTYLDAKTQEYLPKEKVLMVLEEEKAVKESGALKKFESLQELLAERRARKGRVTEETVASLHNLECMLSPSARLQLLAEWVSQGNVGWTGFAAFALERIANGSVFHHGSGAMPREGDDDERTVQELISLLPDEEYTIETLLDFIEVMGLTRELKRRLVSDLDDR